MKAYEVLGVEPNVLTGSSKGGLKRIETKKPGSDLTGQASFISTVKGILLDRGEDAVLASFHEFVLRELAVAIGIVAFAARLDRSQVLCCFSAVNEATFIGIRLSPHRFAIQIAWSSCRRHEASRDEENKKPIAEHPNVHDFDIGPSSPVTKPSGFRSLLVSFCFPSSAR
jgi:hypothetical protein